MKRHTKFSKNVLMKMGVISIGIVLLFLYGQSASEISEKTQEAPIQFKVAAYNVRVGRNAAPEEIGATLKPYDLDVICFSEAPDGDWTKRAGAILGMEHVVIGRYSTAGHVDKYKTIASKTPLYGYEEILMADTLHTVTRAITKVKGIAIAIHSVHFPKGWRDQAHIDETTGKITAFIDNLKKRPAEEIAVVMGDFNFVPSSPDSSSMYHKMFIDIGLDMSWTDLKIDATNRNTSRVFKSERERIGHVIDHIMYNPEKVKAVDGEIIELEKPLSDHKPVWALLELK
ncbi:MAG: endonuclease/exonuclease/phosphatase family protein [Candidatus Latescibacteria bacterium]|nr:endonuclease/exonuclease/phosphatase family protein [Candidatus Latescibacterota bacterium]